MVSGLEILGGFGSVVSKSIQNIVLTIIQELTNHTLGMNLIDIVHVLLLLSSLLVNQYN